ncbi:MAG: DinB family protein [Ignavibacteria bacterium]|nr:DinB family protein [Ignavibacteria bacterium]
MTPSEIILQLGSGTDVFANLFTGISHGQIKYKPSPDKWCLLEIVSHLYDEEVYDFKPRLKKILDEDHDWEPIDPQGWVVSRNYMNNNFHKTLNNFLEERKRSADWLSNLQVNDWNVKAVHPKFGEFSAFQMLCNWLAHDYLHIRQITGVKYQLLKSSLNKDELGYAGDW